MSDPSLHHQNDRKQSSFQQGCQRVDAPRMGSNHSPGSWHPVGKTDPVEGGYPETESPVVWTETSWELWRSRIEFACNVVHSTEQSQRLLTLRTGYESAPMYHWPRDRHLRRADGTAGQRPPGAQIGVEFGADIRESLVPLQHLCYRTGPRLHTTRSSAPCLNTPWPARSTCFLFTSLITLPYSPLHSPCRPTPPILPSHPQPQPHHPPHARLQPLSRRPDRPQRHHRRLPDIRGSLAQRMGP